VEGNDDMTERKKLPEQRGAHIYRGTQRASSTLVPRSLKRVVTVPQESDPSAAWQTFAQRQKQIRSKRDRPQKRQKLVARTFKQTGVRATSGRIQAMRRPLPYRRRSSIPVRSGRRRVRRVSMWKLLLVMIAILAIIFLVNFLLNSPLFRVQKVQINGTRDTALVHNIQSMNIVGQNMLLLSMSDVRAHIQSSPLVASVQLSKQWPDQLTVNIVERKPALLWQTTYGTFSVDQTGMVIAPENATMRSNLPGTVIDQTDPTYNGVKTVPSLRPGMYLKNVDIPFAREILQKVPKVTGINVFKLYYDGTMYASTINPYRGEGDSQGSYILESPDGWSAYLGGAHDANSLDNRLLELRAVLNAEQQKKQSVATIDVRYGLSSVVTLYE
jgi:hypothetical protein